MPNTEERLYVDTHVHKYEKVFIYNNRIITLVF